MTGFSQQIKVISIIKTMKQIIFWKVQFRMPALSHFR